MAGDLIEEPFSISFQADSVHSGSISFGRYEKESLDWERRSSFSHNKYLEEAEKCLKPGSVTEKKAYLEAHFKRKGGILSPGSISSPTSCGAYQNTETNVRRDVFNSSRFQETGLENGNCNSEEYNYENEYGSETIDYDESHEVWGYEGEYDEATEHERENNGEEETHKAENESDWFPVKGCEPEAILEVNHDESSQHIDLSSQSYPAAESDTATSENQSYKSSPAVKNKTKKSKTRTETVVESQNKTLSRKSPKTTAKTLNRREKESLTDKKREKLAPQVVPPTKYSPHRMPKAEAEDKLKAKLKHEREPRGKTSVCSQTSTAKKGESRAYEEQSRPKRTINSTKPDPISGSLPFNFKSHERAERRKEFLMKLEEKMNAKEAEMNQLQEKTKEKKEAELKKLRKSLNFKATPIPSFYHSAVPASSDRNKDGSSINQSAKLRHKPISPASGGAGKTASFSKADRESKMDEKLKTTRSGNNNEMLSVRKSIKGIRIGSSVPVGVAS
ncbi:protein WVD2-like 7 [Rutidosis leptorrhynchoides]|uniref:protein WVD2-like 7 n=1 Tax=Rutidosis leptorrhynchoides TaxID=125765 RepID=UPI003A99AD60